MSIKRMQLDQQSATDDIKSLFLGRVEPLISDFLTTALEKSLPTVGGKTQILKTHTS